MAKIALIGDYSPDVTAHRAIPRAIELATPAGQSASATWVGTSRVNDAPRDLAEFDAIWVVPASPYENMAGALAAIRFARETMRPFLGTCGGFQHALIEFARNVAHLSAADHAETNPDGDTLVVTRLSCSLVEQIGTLRLVPGSKLQRAYGAEVAHEGYRCNYGPSERYRAQLERAGFRFTAFDENGDVRGGELADELHPFFVGTLFQPERAALNGRVPAIVRAFVTAALRRR